MATVRAIDVRGGAGPASPLSINDSVLKPQPKPSECLVKVKAFGLNRADTLQREGRYPVPPGITNIMGSEFSGVVEEVGSDTAAAGGEDYRVGDEVFGLTYGGAYAEYVAVSKKMLLRKPAELSWQDCAAVPEVWMTALQAIHLVGEYTPSKVKSILWHAGASSVSIAGIQLSLNLASAPLKVYATTRQDAKCDFVTKQIGAHAAFNTTKSHPAADGSVGGTWADEVKRVNGGEGVDLVMDFVGAPYFAANLAVLAKDGRVVQLGVMGGTILPAGVYISSFVMKRASFVGCTLKSRDAEYQGELRDLFAETVVPKLVMGDYRCSVEKVLSWRKIEKAHGMLEGNFTMGKVVCWVD
ncbi:quinone oxidoreductase like protein [Zymoseptoria brevis]|uniref:Quinone oxidoreductase like protein n=1 Tax=Zymoseptoria brevis TaxID=1047168 RepID=A0A0F4GWJ2_9PEZI|nr:quinone oxidoreductase like protein [Zymoseptoria brevis]